MSVVYAAGWNMPGFTPCHVAEFDSLDAAACWLADELESVCDQHYMAVDMLDCGCGEGEECEDMRRLAADLDELHRLSMGEKVEDVADTWQSWEIGGYVYWIQPV